MSSVSQSKALENRDLSCVSAFLLSNFQQKDNMILSSMAVKKGSTEMKMTHAILELSTLNGIPDIITEVMTYAQIALESENCSKLRDFLLQIAMQISTGANSVVGISPVTAFNLWSILSEHLHIDCAVKLCLCMEDLMSKLFSEGDPRAQWDVYQLLIKTTPELVTKKWLRTTQMRASSVESGLKPFTQCFLSAVLAYDCSDFACVTKVLSDVEKDSELATLWTHGHMDMLASTFLIQTRAQLNHSGCTLYRSALSVVGKRLSSMIDQEVSLYIRVLFVVVYFLVFTMFSADSGLAYFYPKYFAVASNPMSNWEHASGPTPKTAEFHLRYSRWLQIRVNR